MSRVTTTVLTDDEVQQLKDFLAGMLGVADWREGRHGEALTIELSNWDEGRTKVSVW
jgi:hypothetical protein